MAAIAAMVSTMVSVVRRIGSSHRQSTTARRIFRPTVRDDHGNLGYALEQVRLLHDVPEGQPQPTWPKQHPETKLQRRDGEGQALEEKGGKRVAQVDSLA